MLKCSIGIMAYNEEKNIGKLLLAIQEQNLNLIEIEEIIVVASGCTDKTTEVVKDFRKKNQKITLIIQEKREGKSSAINLWLKKAKNNILILESADTCPRKDALEKLVSPFKDETIGMTGGRPIPTDSLTHYMGFVNHFMWNLHHLIALSEPKMGEMIAFRKIFNEIPISSAVDEASVEDLIKNKGLKINYIPEAIVNNKGPETTKDFLKQRRRIYAGHLSLKDEGHEVSTMNGSKIFLLILKNKLFSLKKTHLILLAIFLEMYGRLLGWYDYRIKKKNHSIWEIAESTKKL
jgi:poly-beta-1,6-N-acetyl-D-glucosamine synthase